jgi:hypothetical protein
MPTEDWGGDGILGASVAHGYLHLLPSKACKTIGKSLDMNNNNNRAIHSAFGLNDNSNNNNILQQTNNNNHSISNNNNNNNNPLSIDVEDAYVNPYHNIIQNLQPN